MEQNSISSAQKSLPETLIRMLLHMVDHEFIGAQSVMRILVIILLWLL